MNRIVENTIEMAKVLNVPIPNWRYEVIFEPGHV